MKKLMINLSRAQQEADSLSEEVAALLNESMKYLTRRAYTVTGESGELKIELSVLAEHELTVALACLPWLMIEDPRQFCRVLANDMVVAAIQQARPVLKEGVATALLKGKFNLLPPAQQIEKWEMLGEWADCCADALDGFDDVNSCAIGMAQSAIADTDFESITEVESFVFGAPLRVFNAWLELAVIASPEMQAVELMRAAAANAEEQWRQGTELKFDFSSEAISNGYWSVYKGITLRYQMQVETQAKAVLSQLSVI